MISCKRTFRSCNFVLFLVFSVANPRLVWYSYGLLTTYRGCRLLESELLASTSVTAPSERSHILNVAVVGAGPSGLLLTHLLLQQDNTKVTVMESRSDPRTKESEQRAYALGVGIRGRTAIRNVDEELWQAVKNRGYESERFQLHVGGLVIPLRSEKDSTTTDGVTVEPSVLMFQTELCGALLDVLERRYQDSERLDIHYETTIDDCILETMKLKLNSKTSDSIKRSLAPKSFDLIVGSDGVNSVVRSAIARSHPGFQYSKVRLPGNFKVVRLDVVPARVDPTSVSLILPKSGSTSAFVEPTGTDGSCCILFAGRGDSPILSETQNKTNLIEDLLASFPQWRNNIDEMTGQLMAQTKAGIASSVVCNTYHYRDKAVLIGDAAHATGGVSGQGVNSALQDCWVLADCLLSNREQVGNALLSYSKKQVLEGKALFDLSFGPKPQGVKAIIWAFRSARDALFRGRLGIGRPPLQSRLTTTLTPFSEIRRESDEFYSEPFPCKEYMGQKLDNLHVDSFKDVKEMQ